MHAQRVLSTLAVTASLLVLAAVPAGATALAPFIDLQEAGLTLASDGVGLIHLGTGSETLTVDVGGPVRFALLYWAGRERPCTETSPGSGDCTGFSQPFEDQRMVFDGHPLTGTVIGTETQPASGGGPILDIGYFADVTSIVASRGTGLQSFGLADGDTASNLWRLDGAGLLVAYTDPGDPTVYRVQVFDGLDFAFGEDPTPGDPRVTAPVVCAHGLNHQFRHGDLVIFAGDCTADRPDLIDITNNTSLVDQMTSNAGSMFDVLSSTIDIPADVDSTTVHASSTPAGSFPDSLLLELVALRVPQNDTAPPTCPLTAKRSGPPTQIDVTFRDTDTGLGELVLTESVNADVSIPPFTVGTTDPVVVTATKIDQSKGSRVAFRVVDQAGNVALCDPILTLAVRETGKPVTQTLSDIPREESAVTVTNGSPGVRHLEVVVNGRKFNIGGLKDGAETTLDVSSAMTDGTNTIVLRATGKPGGSAEVLVWDGVSP